MRRILLITLLLCIASGICLFPFKQYKSIRLDTSYFIAFQQIAKPANWLKWQPELRAAMQKDSAHLKITKKGNSFSIQGLGIVLNVHTTDGFNYRIDKNINGVQTTYTFLILPDTHNGSAVITLPQQASIAQCLVGTPNSAAAYDLNQLKNYLNDTRLYYGFSIKKDMVVDSNIVVEKKIVPTRQQQAGIAQVQQDLKAFVAQRHLHIVQPVIADIRPEGNNSVRLMIGYPVNQETPSAGQIRFMHLPTHGRMLTGFYSGRYKDREKLYSAMRSYLTDHNLAMPEDPYEKYLDNKIPATDTSFVRLQVNFPIY